LIKRALAGDWIEAIENPASRTGKTLRIAEASDALMNLKILKLDNRIVAIKIAILLQVIHTWIHEPMDVWIDTIPEFIVVCTATIR
jgi:hypothetical protein